MPMKPESKWVQKPINALTVVAGLIMLLMMLHIVADVAGRMIFNTPIDGTTEIVSGYYMVAVIFFPLAYVSHNDGHIMVELFTRHLPERRVALLDALVGLACLAFLVWFAWESVASAAKSTARNEQWETSIGLLTIWPSRWFLAVGLLFMGGYMVVRIIEDFRQAAVRK